jgi:RNA polymerase sigma-70 factor (ECF subfamily)
MRNGQQDRARCWLSACPVSASVGQRTHLAMRPELGVPARTEKSLVTQITGPRSTPFSSLLVAAQGGDEQAYALIWRAYQPALLRYLRVKAGAGADDLAAETWLQVCRKLTDFAGGATEFRAWLFTIARNRHIDARRRSSRRKEVFVEPEDLDVWPSPDDPVMAAEARMSTDRALALIATLPPRQAEAVMLREVAGFSVSEVARIMNRPPGAVRVLCHRGLRHLAETLQGPFVFEVPAPGAGRSTG